MKISVFLVCCFSSLIGFSQIQGDGGELISSNNPIVLGGITPVFFNSPNIKQLRAEDASEDEKGSKPWRFGYNHETNLNLLNSGNWFTLADGSKLWVLKITSDKAQTINLTFNNTKIPSGNELYVYNPDKSFILGKFTQKHIYDGQLGTELIPGETVILEYCVPANNASNVGSLNIEKVTHGYRLVDEFVEKAFGQAGSCHMNVNCTDGVPFSDQKRSVVMLVSGSNGFCSGALINNTEYDGKPYVLTANHCYSNPATWVFRFNWESPDCNNPSLEPSFSSLSGSTLRARKLHTDFCLVEITGGLESGTVPASYNAFFSGWDRTGDAPEKTYGIHHPRGDIKKISFDDQPSVATQSTIAGVTSDPFGVWRVQWDRSTTTEGVSSGSPLFNGKRIVGQLWGGQALCSNPAGFDYYGRISSSWEPTGSDQTNQLKHWLDPNGIGTPIVEGYQPGMSVANDAAIILLKNVSGTMCTPDVTPKFTLVNTGQNTMTSAVIKYGFDGVENLTYNWSGSLSFLQLVEISLPQTTLTAGSHTFSITVQSINGIDDDITDNNNLHSSLHIMIDPQLVDLNIVLDCYARETSWELKNNSNESIYKSPFYINADEGLKSYEFCLSDDCYTFTIFDTALDGLSGCGSGDGSFQILDASLSVLGELTTAQANFGGSYSVNFCLSDASIQKNMIEFDVFPNPTSGYVSWNTNELKKIYVFDMSGKVLKTQNVDASTKQLDMTFLSNGVYFVEFELLNNLKYQTKIVLTK